MSVGNGELGPELSDSLDIRYILSSHNTQVSLLGEASNEIEKHQASVLMIQNTDE